MTVCICVSLSIQTPLSIPFSLPRTPSFSHNTVHLFNPGTSLHVLTGEVGGTADKAEGRGRRTFKGAARAIMLARQLSPNTRRKKHKLLSNIAQLKARAACTLTSSWRLFQGLVVGVLVGNVGDPGFQSQLSRSSNLTPVFYSGVPRNIF